MKYYEHTLRNLNTLVSKTLTSAPADWDDLTRFYVRHDIYHSILRSDTTSQRFVFDGGELTDKGGGYLIKDAYNTDGVKAQVEYRRRKLNPFTKVYDDDYIGMIEFTPESGFTIEKEYIECKSIDSAKLNAFISNDEKEINLNSITAINGNSITPFTNSPRGIEFTPINLYLDTRTSGSINTNPSNITTPDSDQARYLRSDSLNLLLDRYKETGEVIYINTTSDTIELDLISNMSYAWEFIFIPLTGINRAAVTSNLVALLYNDLDAQIDAVTYATKSKNVFDIIDTETYSFTSSIQDTTRFSVPAGGYVKFLITWSVSNIVSMDVDLKLKATVTDYDLIEFYESIATEDVQCWAPNELCLRAIQIMTGETDISKLFNAPIFGSTTSEYAPYASDGALRNIMTTNGKLVRGFPSVGVKITFRDWFKSIGRMNNLALWFDKTNDRFKIGERFEVYEQTEMFDLGTVKDLKITPHTEGYFSDILSGTSEKGDYEEIQGIYEYNIKSTHSVDVPVKDKLDLRIPYNIDSLSMEFARRQQYTLTGITDTKYDDKNFLVSTDGVKVKVNSDYRTTSGFLGIGERYNGEYTPRKIITNNGHWIQTPLFKELSTSFIKFETNTRDLNVVINGIAEQSNILKSELSTPISYPEVYEFKSIATNAHIQELESNPHRYIAFNDDDGNKLYGHILNVSIKDHKREAEYKLLRYNK